MSWQLYLLGVLISTIVWSYLFYQSKEELTLGNICLALIGSFLLSWFTIVLIVLFATICFCEEYLDRYVIIKKNEK
jgi:membrane protease YdiL (CAAX protease family)